MRVKFCHWSLRAVFCFNFSRVRRFIFALKIVSNLLLLTYDLLDFEFIVYRQLFTFFQGPMSFNQKVVCSKPFLAPANIYRFLQQHYCSLITIFLISATNSFHKANGPSLIIRAQFEFLFKKQFYQHLLEDVLSFDFIFNNKNTILK